MRLYGVVDLVRARHEGATFDSDVFLVEKGVLPATVAQAAHVRVTRVEPEIFVPPRPGQPVRRAVGKRRDEALFFDGMERRLPIGLSRDGEPVFANLDFLDGTRGAHVNISGISGVATKTSYATFLLHSLFRSGALAGEAANTHAIVFNVKGEDLLFLDQPNARLEPKAREDYARLGLPAEPFDSVQVLAPVRPGSRERMPATGSRQKGVSAFFWTLREVVTERLLRFLFAEAEDAASQLSFVVDKIEAKLAAAAREKGRPTDPWIEVEGRRIDSFDALVEVLTERDPDLGGAVPGRAVGLPGGHRDGGRLRAAAACRRPPRGAPHPRRRTWGSARTTPSTGGARQLSVVDIHSLHDRAKRFVVGAVLKRMFEEKEALGTARPLVFVVLDELNKYAPREGTGPDQGGAPRHLRAGAQPGHRAHRGPADRERGRGPHRRQRGPAGGGPARHRRGRALRVRLPHRRRPRPGRDPQAGHDDRAAARDPDAAPRALPVPGLGHPQDRGRHRR